MFKGRKRRGKNHGNGKRPGKGFQVIISLKVLYTFILFYCANEYNFISCQCFDVGGASEPGFEPATPPPRVLCLHATLFCRRLTGGVPFCRNGQETQTEVVWSSFPFIRPGQNHLARHSERGKKTRQTEEEVGRQHQGMDRPGVRQVREAVKNREKWRKLVVKSSVVPQRPSWLRDR